MEYKTQSNSRRFTFCRLLVGTIASGFLAVAPVALGQGGNNLQAQDRPQAQGQGMQEMASPNAGQRQMTGPQMEMMQLQAELQQMQQELQSIQREALQSEDVQQRIAEYRSALEQKMIELADSKEIEQLIRRNFDLRQMLQEKSMQQPEGEQEQQQLAAMVQEFQNVQQQVGQIEEQAQQTDAVTEERQSLNASFEEEMKAINPEFEAMTKEYQQLQAEYRQLLSKLQQQQGGSGMTAPRNPRARQGDSG